MPSLVTDGREVAIQREKDRVRHGYPLAAASSARRATAADLDSPQRAATASRASRASSLMRTLSTLAERFSSGLGGPLRASLPVRLPGPVLGFGLRVATVSPREASG